MQSQIKLLTGDEINKFSTIVRNKSSKLGASDLVRLEPSIYRDYIQNIKYFAGTSSTKVRPQSRRQPQSSLNPCRKLSKQRSQSGIQSACSNPSFYYSGNLEIMSMKEFIILLQESKHKQEREQRVMSRIREKQFVHEVGKQIQSSHTRNLRLTSSSAHRISQRIKQKRHEHIFEE